MKLHKGKLAAHLRKVPLGRFDCVIHKGDMVTVFRGVSPLIPLFPDGVMKRIDSSQKIAANNSNDMR